MSSGSPTVSIKIAFTDPELTAAERDEEAIRLLTDLGDRREVEEVDRVRDPNPPEGNKSIGGFLPGWLLAEVSVGNTTKLLGFLMRRLANKEMSFELEVNDQGLTSLKIKGHGLSDLDAALQKVQALTENEG